MKSFLTIMALATIIILNANYSFARGPWGYSYCPPPVYYPRHGHTDPGSAFLFGLGVGAGIGAAEAITRPRYYAPSCPPQPQCWERVVVEDEWYYDRYGRRIVTRWHRETRFFDCP